MFDLGWGELLLIMAIGVIVIGPKELPVMMRTLGRMMRRLQYVRYAFTQQFEDFMQTHDLDELRKSVNFETENKSRDFNESEADAEDVVPLDPPKKIEDQDDKP